jgi:glutamine synthetase
MLAMDAADAMLLFRTLVKQTCARNGFHASFMSLPRIDGFDPSGWHLHQSIINKTTGRNLFAVDSTTEGMSSEGKAYVEGILTRARDFCMLSVPTVNGYRRLAPDFSLSPTRIGWSFEDRTAMIRIIGIGDSTHIENRVGEPCANPYLAIGSQLFAGLDALVGDPGSSQPEAQDLQPDLAARDGSHETLPLSLREALTAFRSSRHVRDLLGTPLTSCLVKLKESESSRFEAWCSEAQPPANEVTEWEHREYFRVF